MWLVDWFVGGLLGFQGSSSVSDDGSARSPPGASHLSKRVLELSEPTGERKEGIAQSSRIMEREKGLLSSVLKLLNMSRAEEK